jgi:hypothetical protein
LERPEEDLSVNREDGSDSPQRDEAHRCTIGDDQDKWVGWPPGVRYPLDVPEVSLRRVDAVANSMLQVCVEDGSSTGFEFAHH